MQTVLSTEQWLSPGRLEYLHAAGNIWGQTHNVQGKWGGSKGLKWDLGRIWMIIALFGYACQPCIWHRPLFSKLPFLSFLHDRQIPETGGDAL